MDREQILAFRLARSGLATRDASGPADAAACPASDFSRDAALLALSARDPGLTREAFGAAVEAGDELVLAHVVRGAIHALPAAEHALFGRALLARDDAELARQLGPQVAKLTAEHGIAPKDALAEVTEATEEALGGGRTLSKDDLHEELRGRLRAELMPWCKGCGSHHAAPMLWRFASVDAGARIDSERRYRLSKPGRARAADALGRFLSFYAPATPGDFAEWAGIGKAHAERVWGKVEADLVEVRTGRRAAWALAADEDALDSPPAARGVVLIPPGDPYLQKVNRSTLLPEADLRKRFFRPVASPGAVLADGRLVGLWRVKAKGRRAEFTVERTGRVARAALMDEVERIAALRGASDAVLTLA